MNRNESWVDRQVREAQERGEFDNLPGAGKPIPGLNGRDDADWWIKGLIEREKITPPLPTSLMLRREIEDLLITVADVKTEDAVREIVGDLNNRIKDSRRRRVDGPPVFIQTVDVERILREWRERRSLGN